MFFSKGIQEIFRDRNPIRFFKELDKEGVHIIHRTDDIVFYKKRKFTLKENDVIFTHTGNLNNLFYDQRKCLKLYLLLLYLFQYLVSCFFLYVKRSLKKQLDFYLSKSKKNLQK